MTELHADIAPAAPKGMLPRPPLRLSCVVPAHNAEGNLEAFLRVVADDHNLEVGAKAREEPKSPMQARLRKKRRSRTGSRPKSATKLRPKSATRL